MKTTIELTPFKALIVTADANSSGSVRRLAQSGDSAQYAATSVSASSSVTVGPFSQSRNYEVLSDAGRLTYAFADSEPTADSAGLSASLSDETGTGKAVFNDSPVITSFAEITAAESAPAASSTGVRLYVVVENGLKVLKARFAGGSITIATDPD